MLQMLLKLAVRISRNYVLHGLSVSGDVHNTDDSLAASHFALNMSHLSPGDTSSYTTTPGPTLSMVPDSPRPSLSSNHFADQAESREAVCSKRGRPVQRRCALTSRRGRFCNLAEEIGHPGSFRSFGVGRKTYHSVFGPSVPK